MNVFSISLKNLKSCLNFYKMQILAMVFSIGMFYNFESLKYGSEEFKFLYKSSAKFASAAALVLMVIFMAFFIAYSNGVYLKKRKSELGMYCFMGMTTKELGRMYFFEAFIQGIISTILGIGFGVVTNKLFFLVLNKISIDGVQIPFSFSFSATARTLLIFVVFYLITSIVGYISIRRSVLIDLFNAEKKEDKIIKPKKLRGIIGLGLILGAYFFIAGKVSVFSVMKSPLVVLMVTIGTVLLYKELIPMILRGMQKNKKLCYKGINVVVIANLVYRIRKNYRSLAAVAILVASAITAFATCYSFLYMMDANQVRQSPYDVQVLVSGDDYEQTYGRLYEIVEELGTRILDEKKRKILLSENCKIENDYNLHVNINGQECKAALIAYSDSKELQKHINSKKINRSIKELELDENEAVRSLDLKVIVSGTMEEKIKIKDQEILSKGTALIIDYGSIINDYNPFIVRDEDYEKYKENFEEKYVLFFDIENKACIKELEKKILQDFSDSDEDINIFTREDVDNMVIRELGIFFFVGGIIAMVFIVASGAMIYFNIISEAIGDKEKYTRLMNSGVVRREIWLIVMKQGGIQCLLPLITGIIHSAVALYVLSKLTLHKLYAPFIICVSILAIVYVTFYFLAVMKFMSIATSEEKRIM